MQNDLFNQYSMYEIRKNEKRELSKAYQKIGLSLLVFFLLSVAFSFLYAFLYYVPVVSKIIQNEAGEYLLTTVVNVVCLVVPVLILNAGKKNDLSPKIAPLKTATTLKYVSLGFGVFYVSNLVSNLISSYASIVGITLTQPDFSAPSSPVAVFIYFIEYTLIAGIFEELLFRGAVLGSLRRFGDKTAILASAFLFAVFHGNLIQAPFAFVLGLYLGYVACKTGNLLYPVLIHALNNGLACILTFFSEILNENVYNLISIVYVGFSILLGIIGLIFELLTSSKEQPLRREEGILTIPQKFGRLFASASIIALIIIYLIITSNYIHFGPVAN